MNTRLSNSPAPAAPQHSAMVDVGLTLESGSYVPFYEQIAEQIRTLIRSEKLTSGQTFFSEGEVARALGISKMPVRQAFQRLRWEGLLMIERGKKPLIGSGLVPWNFQQLRGFSEEMRRKGLVPSAQVLGMDLVEPELLIAQALRLALEGQAYRLRRLRFVNAEPVAVVTSYLPAGIFDGINKYDFEKRSLYDVIENIYGRKLQRAEEVIGAITAEENDAKVLQARIGSALLIIKETTYDGSNIPIEYSVSLLRSDRYTASVVSVRKQ